MHSPTANQLLLNKQWPRQRLFICVFYKCIYIFIASVTLFLIASKSLMAAPVEQDTEKEIYQCLYDTTYTKGKEVINLLTAAIESDCPVQDKAGLITRTVNEGDVDRELVLPGKTRCYPVKTLEDSIQGADSISYNRVFDYLQDLPAYSPSEQQKHALNHEARFHHIKDIQWISSLSGQKTCNGIFVKEMEQWPRGGSLHTALKVGIAAYMVSGLPVIYNKVNYITRFFLPDYSVYFPFTKLPVFSLEQLLISIGVVIFYWETSI